MPQDNSTSVFGPLLRPQNIQNGRSGYLKGKRKAFITLLGCKLSPQQVLESHSLCAGD